METNSPGAYVARDYIGRRTRKGFIQFEIIINVLFSSFDLLEYLCYGSTTITNIVILSERESH